MVCVDLLRFALAYPDDVKEAEKALKNAIKWRQTTGKSIVDAAKGAVAKATANGGWDNDVVRDAAPHADVINDFITPRAVITTSTEDGDLVYVIRASQIDDKELMTWTTVWQLRRRTGKPARPDSIRTLGPEQMTGISEGLIAH